MEPKLAEALGPFKDYFELQEDGKLTCLVNGHSFPAKRPEQIAAFVKGARFAKLKVRYDAEMALVKYEPFIVISKNFPHMLYCALTGQLLEKSLAAVKTHMGGKRFVRAKAQFVADLQDLKPEPTLKEFGIVLPGEDADAGGRRRVKKQQKAGGEVDDEMEESGGEGDKDSDGGPEIWLMPREGRRAPGGRLDDTGVSAESSSDMEEEEEEEKDSEGAATSDEEEEKAMGGRRRPLGTSDTGHATAVDGRPTAASARSANGSSQLRPKEQQAGKQQEAGKQQRPKQQNHKRKKTEKQILGEATHKTKVTQQQQQNGGPKVEAEQLNGVFDSAGAALGKNGKQSKKQRKKEAAAAAAPKPDDFDFDMDANSGKGGGDEDMVEAVPAQSDRPVGRDAALTDVKPKKKNVNRPSVMKKARKD